MAVNIHNTVAYISLLRIVDNVCFFKQFFIQEAQTYNIGVHEPHGQPWFSGQAWLTNYSFETLNTMEK